MVKVLGIDEYLEGPALFVLGAFIEHDVIDGHVHGVIRHRRLDLVGGADQHLGPLHLLGHADDLGRYPAGTHTLGCGGQLVSVLVLLDAILDDTFVDAC